MGSINPSAQPPSSIPIGLWRFVNLFLPEPTATNRTSPQVGATLMRWRHSPKFAPTLYLGA